jgi:hypothetical protein
MTRLDLIGVEAVQRLEELAEQFGVKKIQSAISAEDLHGGIKSIGDLPCLSNLPQVPIDFVMEGVIAYGAITLVWRQVVFRLATIIFPVASRRLLPAGTKVSGLKLS